MAMVRLLLRMDPQEIKTLHSRFLIQQKITVPCNTAFFADSGEGDELEVELGGLEDGVDAPPAEEYLEGSIGSAENLEWAEPNGNNFQNNVATPQSNEIPSVQNSESGISRQFQDLSIASTLLAKDPPKVSSGIILLTPDSFRADPIAGPPRRHSTTSVDWPPAKTLTASSLTSQQGTTGASSQGLQGEEISNYSNFGPNKSFSHTPGIPLPAGRPALGRLSTDSLHSVNSTSQFAPWQQRLLQNNNIQQTPPIENRPMTLEEVEARMFSQNSPEPQISKTPTPALQYSQQQIPQRQILYGAQPSMGRIGPPNLQRHSADKPGNILPNRSQLSSSLPSGTVRGTFNVGLSSGLSTGFESPSVNMNLSLAHLQGGQRAPITNAPNLQRRSLPGQGSIPLPGTQRPMGGPMQQNWQMGPPGPRPPAQQILLRPAMLGRGPPPGGRGFSGQNAQGPFPGFPLPAPQDGSATAFRYHGSKFMLPEEIDSILRIQWKSLHNGAPYQEDYYYQALMNKISRGANIREFTPDALRDLAPSEKTEEEPLTYVKLEGLGKIPYSDIKRPKPIMDLVASPNDAENEKGEGEELHRKPLEEEPLLAARIVIEDCMCLLLDVDDIDRVLKHHFRGREDEQTASLKHRRILLLDALANSLRLPQKILLSKNSESGEEQETDAVLRRLCGLLKGRKLLARVLRLLADSPPNRGPAEKKIPARRIVWATLRISYLLFSVVSPHAISSKNESDQEYARGMIDSTTEIALAIIKIISRMDNAQAITECMSALVNGDLGSKSSSSSTDVENLLPLLPSGEPSPTNRTWLAEIIKALLNSAGMIDGNFLGRAAHDSSTIETLTGDKKNLAIAWSETIQTFWTVFERHLDALAEVFVMAKNCGADTAANYAREMVPRGLIQTFLGHATRDQQTTMLASLSKIFQ